MHARTLFSDLVVLLTGWLFLYGLPTTATLMFELSVRGWLLLTAAWFVLAYAFIRH
jgi:hypothetical protein